jgi:hypothetical protein
MKNVGPAYFVYAGSKLLNKLRFERIAFRLTHHLTVE